MKERLCANGLLHPDNSRLHWAWMLVLAPTFVESYEILLSFFGHCYGYYQFTKQTKQIYKYDIPAWVLSTWEVLWFYHTRPCLLQWFRCVYAKVDERSREKYVLFYICILMILHKMTNTRPIFIILLVDVLDNNNARPLGKTELAR